MNYFVIMPDGSRYGPATADMLTQWASEGRIQPATVIEIEGSGQQIALSSVPGVILMERPSPIAPPGTPPPFASSSSRMEGFSQPPTMSPYQRGTYDAYGNPAPNSTNFIMSWVCFALSLTSCGPIAAIVGMVLASNAMKAGERGAKAPYTANMISLILGAVMVVGWLVFVAFAMSQGGGHR